jgi:hypothetical protein
MKPTPRSIPSARNARRLAALTLAPMLLSSCLFGRRSGEEPTVTVRVQNNLVPATALTISLLPASGERRTIGVVGPSRSDELRFPAGSSTDPHRLLAEAASGTATASRLFTLSSAATVEWNVGLNTLNVAERR